MLISARSLKLAVLRRLSPLALAASALAAMPAHAVTYTETGDAGQTQATAQSTNAASGALTDIFGALTSTTDADLFLIRITSSSSFSATTVNAGSGQLDTVLFLLTQAGAPVYFNDDGPSGTTLLSLLPAGNAFGPVAPGLYLLGIALSGYDPVNSVNQLLFTNSGVSTDVRGPASGLQPAVLGGFDGSGFAPLGGYDIQLTGAVAAVPEPASALMFLLAGALGAGAHARRSRRTQTTPVQA